ncbi:MAG TPA: SGNH/GDSL hydrolase family protein [Candidatus Atribacteria bacterium]|nr:SGNH/GDSL hydrolase family protein [Candidatus Atribacteria bacterium]
MEKEGAKRILCFGDSLTWGADPETGGRHPVSSRWTTLLQKNLGENYWIIEEGLGGRTTIWDDPIEGDKNGRRHLPILLESHRPLDLVVIMLGTNDLKSRFHVSAFEIAQSASTLVEVVKRSSAGRGGNPPLVLLIAPPPLGRLTIWQEEFGEGVEKSRNLARFYSYFAQLNQCHFFDAGEVVKTSDIDGIHWEANANRQFAEALAEKIKGIL